MKFDPELRLSEGDAALVRDAVDSMRGALGPFMVSVFDEALAVEIRNGDLWVRAATGDEVTDMLSAGHDGDDGLDWPGDPADEIEHEITWQEKADGLVDSDPACKVWSGEVLLQNGRGLCGPLYVYDAAARAWAYSTALGLPSADVFEAQVVPYVVARRFAPDLLRNQEESRRLARFWVSPLRTSGPPFVVRLPA